MRELITPLVRAARALADVGRGAAGLDAYAAYLEHCQRHHPERVPWTREEFFRHDQDARWSGLRRCC